eukprot:4369973-Amphidinium_carterae.1
MPNNRHDDHLYDMHAEIRLSSCRFNNTTLDHLQKEFEVNSVPRKEIAKQFENKLSGVAPLAASAVMEMEMIRTSPLGGKLADMCPWLKTVALNRDCFRHCVFELHTSDAPQYYYFLFAMQSPYVVQCLRLQEVDVLSVPSLPNPVDTPGTIDMVFQWQYAWSSVDVSIVEGRQFACPETKQVHVIPNVWFAGENMVVSESVAMPWEVYAGGFQRVGSASGDKALDRSALLANAHLPAWVHDFIENPSLSHVESVVQHYTSEEGAECDQLASDDDSDMVDVALGKAFKALQLEVIKQPEHARKVSMHFKVQVEKRAAGSVNHDSEFTAYQGVARTQDAKAFCVALGLRRTAQFDTKTFGPRNAYVCAHEWADVMDFLLEHWVLACKSVQTYKETPFAERFQVSVAMVKTLRCLSGKLKSRALDVLSLADLTESEIYGS